MNRAVPIVLLTMCIGLLVEVEALAEDPQTEHVTFHVSSIQSGDATADWCSTGKCSAKKFTVEGYTDSTEYVLECIELFATEPTPHYTIVCPKLHAHNDYDARLGADFIAFGDDKKTTVEPFLSAYQIVSEKELAKHK